MSTFSSNTSYNVIHSYPFINDGPKLQLASSEQLDCYTRHVPPGVLHIQPTWKPVKLDEKPPFSYATIIAHAILSSEHRKLTLSEIYGWISEKYPCYSIKDHRWQNSIRHNLSLQKAFVKLDRDSTTPSGKGCFWTILPGYEQQFIDNLVKRGVGSTNASTKHQQDNGHKQFKKFIDSSCNKPTSHLFTIFRMNPTSNGVQKRKKKKMSRVKNKTIAAAPVKYQLEQEDHDSDCDSGVDLGCGGPFPKERASPTKDYYSSLLESSLLEEDLFNLPSSIIMDSHQNLFDDVYWPQTQQTQYEPLDCYFDTSFNQQNYLLYNDILSSQNL